MGRFLLVESCCYVVSELVKCCSRRMFRFEAVLVVDRRYVIGDVGRMILSRSLAVGDKREMGL